MTTINNIMQPTAPTAQKAAQANGLNEKGPTLSDFIGMILSPTDAAAATQNVPLSATDMKALAEKVAALLNGQGEIDAANTSFTSLTQDLSAALATQLQSTEDMPPVSDTDMAELAALLNDMEPGGTAEKMANLLQAQVNNTAQSQATPHHTTKPSDDAPPPAPQAQQAAPDSKTQNQPQLQTPAITGQNAQSGMGQQGFGNGFDQQSGFMFFANADSAATSGLDSSTALNSTQQSFANYTQAATGQTLPPQTTQMIALQIQRNASAKVDSFTLQLEPADLGRLDVELKFHRDGSIQAHLSAERPETLAMLQKDSAQLERILQQAGFNTNDESLSFDLRQQNNGDDASGTGKKRASGNQGSIGTDNNGAADIAAAANTRTEGYIGLQGVNIMV